MTVQNATTTQTPSKRPTGITRIARIPRAYTVNEIRSEHCTAGSLFLTFEGRVYDVTEFINDHPGGTEIILEFAGEDVTDVLRDPAVHEHSTHAFKMLESYYVGWLAEGEGAKTFPEAIQQGKQIAENALRQRRTGGDSTANGVAQQQEDGPFLDLEKPLIHQVYTLSIGKEGYMREVHRAQYLPHPSRFFSSPILEALTSTPWFVVPFVWVPITLFLLTTSLPTLGLKSALLGLAGGMFGWTLIEYVMHRFLLHADEILPDKPGWLSAHFLLHGVHHFLPMDRFRLVFPPALAIPVALPIYLGLRAAMQGAHANVTFAGLLTGYIFYDMTHYYLHHGRPAVEHFREMKSYHLAHHYKNENLGYGVTSKLWDFVFGTVLRI